MIKWLTFFAIYIFCSLMIAGCGNKPLKEYKWNKANGYRWSELSTDVEGMPGFTKRMSAISFTNNLPLKDILENRHYLNGSGVALGDIDGDGWTDIYLAQLNGPNQLFKNNGNFSFEDITDSAGVSHSGYYSTGASFADVDGDGDLDLFVGSMSQDNVLYINDGEGHFQPKEQSGIEEAQGTMSMAWGDIDSDGDLDLYVTNYKRKSVLDLFNINDLSWEKTVKETYDPSVDQNYSLVPPYNEHYTIIEYENKVPGRREIGRKDVLYINRGDGTFKKATDLSERFLNSDGEPVGLKREFGLMAKFHDINEDGLPDLYVSNDYWSKDHLWINQGKGIFKEIDPQALRNMSFASMSVDFSDINRDGAWDFFVTEMLSPKHERRLRQYIPTDPFPNYTTTDGRNQPQYNRNSLNINRGDHTFAETAYYNGLEASEWSWASRFLDVDLDGYEDLLVTTGYTYDVQDLDAQRAWQNKIARVNENRSFIDSYPPLQVPNKAFRNKNGLQFEEVGSEWGFTDDDVSHGLASADLDHDGDLDLVVNRLNDEAVIFENTASASRIAVRLTGEAPNTQAVGAKIELLGGDVAQMDEISAGGEYLSSSDPLVVFAAVNEDANYRLKVTWPDGQKSLLDSVQSNRIYEINEESIAKNFKEERHESMEKIFVDVSDKIDHSHHEEPYDDFRVQALLPIKLSRQGPGVAWIDYDSDQDDDLFIGTGRGGSLSVYENRGGEFISRSLPKITQNSKADQTTILGWREDGETKLTVGYANYEPGDIDFPSARTYTYSSDEVAKEDSISGQFSTTGPIAAADYDADGDLDLFVGGRFVPAHYPRNATSRIFENNGDVFVLDSSNSQKLQELGLVTGAVFSDYDTDGDQDLICSLEWGKIKIFQNDGGVFRDVTSSTGLDHFKGWWNGIATGDFNNDGRPDLVATNWGKNSPYQIDSEKPLKMFYQDIDRNGKVDIIESYYNTTKKAYVPRRQMQAFESISNLLSRQIVTNKDYATATLTEILQPGINDISAKEINVLSHTVFLNTKDGFKPRPLPVTSQLSAAFYAGVADYNNDGNEDIFLGQNFFDTYPNTPRLDAGRGLWLKGDGKGNFDVVEGQESGITVYGQQRGASLSDFNKDGKIDLVVSQNGSETKLYKNNTPKSGITIRLMGPPANANSFGSSVRLIYEDGTKGPRREIQAGSGYWSQNSATQILGFSGAPKAIEVQWFDGRSDTVRYKPNQSKYVIDYSK